MFEIVNFYKFVLLNNLDRLREELKGAMVETGVRGTIILANEGFNAMLCGQPEQIKAFMPQADRILGVAIEYKSSFHEAAPLRKIDVKIKPEVVTLKRSVDISLGEGTHVGIAEWNRLISDPETVVLDARNYYEIKIGSFVNAIDPKTEKFSELPDFVAKNLDGAKHKNIAMYCTGGIRCEKFAPYMKQLGFKNVFQLEGGILKYIEKVAPSESLWSGECFVFDERRTIDENLKQGTQKDYSHPDNRDIEDE